VTKNQYEHYMISVEHEVAGGQDVMNMTAISADLSPETPVTMRALAEQEVGEDMDGYVNKARTSMNQVCDRMIEQVVKAAQEQPVAFHGYVDLVDQLQAAPNLLLANMLGGLISSCAEEVLKQQLDEARIEETFVQ